MRRLLILLLIALVPNAVQAQTCVETIPYTEDFSGSGWVGPTNWTDNGSIPSCWTRVNTSNNIVWMASPPSFANNFTGPSGDHTTGTVKYAFVERQFGVTTQASNTALKTPPVDLSSSTNPKISFWYHMYGNNISNLVVRVREYGTTSWTTLGSITRTQANQNSSNAAWKFKEYNLASWAGDTVEFRFVGNATSNWGNMVRMAIDDIRVEETPTCAAPTNLTASAVLSTSATLTWSGVTNPVATQLSYTTGTGGGGTGTIVTGTTHSAALTGLTANTTYKAYARQVCTAGDTSSWSFVEQFTTGCAVYTAPFTENFDGSTWAPSTQWNLAGTVDACWSVTGSTQMFWDVGPLSWSWPQTGPSGDHTTGSDQYAVAKTAQSGNTTVNSKLLSPWIDVSGLTSPELSFWYHGYGATIGNFKVRVKSINGAWSQVFSKQGQTHTSATQAWTEAIIDLSAYAGDTIRLQFFMDRSSIGFFTQFAVDDVSVHEEPTCPKPSATSTAAITASSAQLSWTSGGASNFQIRYRETGTTTWTWIAGSGASHVLSGLTSDTEYEWDVRDSCAQGDVSFWVSGGEFKTLCLPVTAPFVEDFDGSDWVVMGWTNTGAIDDCFQRSSEVDYFWTTGSSSFNHYAGTGPSADNTSGNGKYAFARSVNPFTSPKSTALKTRAIDLDTLQNPELTFYYHMFGPHIDFLRVSVKRVAETNWTTLATISGQKHTSATAAWSPKVLSLKGYEGDTVVLRFMAKRSATTAFAFQAAIAIDDISVLEPTVCPSPDNLTVSNIGYFNADLSWTGKSSYTNVELTAHQASLGTGTRYLANGGTHSFTGLQSGTTYTAHLQDSCSSTLLSSWDTISFTTQVCPAVTASATTSATGKTVTFTNTGSTTDSLYWDLGDGTTSNAQSLTHTYTGNAYTAMLIVTSFCGSTDTLLIPLMFCDTISASYTAVDTYLQVNFDATASTGSGTVTYDWDFGDGNTSSSAQPNHTYGAAGVYNVTLIVNDTCSQADTMTMALRVCSQQAPTIGATQNSMTFDFDLQGGGNPASVTWDFGDGNSSGQFQPSHTYSSHGAYTVTATITDSCENVFTVQTVITTCDPIVGDFTFRIIQATGGGMLVEFTATNTTLAAYHWVFGDGTSATTTNPTIQHLYPSANLQVMVTLNMEDECGVEHPATHYLYEASVEEFSLIGKAYPIPADLQCTLEFKQLFSGTITVMSLTGEVLYHNVLQSAAAVAIETAAWPSGTYTVFIHNGEMGYPIMLVVQH